MISVARCHLLQAYNRDISLVYSNGYTTNNLRSMCLAGFIHRTLLKSNRECLPKCLISRFSDSGKFRFGVVLGLDFRFQVIKR